MAVNDTQYWLHDHHLCIGCKSKDADTLAGHWYCRACSDRRNAIIRSRYDADKDKAIRADRRAKGICTRCGQRPADDGYRTCTKCRTYHAAYQRQHKEQEREKAAEYREANRDEINRKKRAKRKDGKR